MVKHKSNHAGHEHKLCNSLHSAAAAPELPKPSCSAPPRRSPNPSSIDRKLHSLMAGRRRNQQPPPPRPQQPPPQPLQQPSSAAAPPPQATIFLVPSSATTIVAPLAILPPPAPQALAPPPPPLPPPPPAALLPPPNAPPATPISASSRLNPQAREFKPWRISRAIQITGVSPELSDSLLLQELEQWGPIRDYKRIRGTTDVLIVHFYDIRHAIDAVADIQEKAWLYESQQNRYLLLPISWRKGLLGNYIVWADFSPPHVLTGPDAQNQGKLVVFNIDRDTPNSVLRAVFQPYGEIRQIRGPQKARDFRFVEFYDVRAASGAFVQLQGSLLNNRCLGIQYSIHDMGRGGRYLQRHHHQLLQPTTGSAIYYPESQPRPQYTCTFVRYKGQRRSRKPEEPQFAFNTDEPDESRRTTLMIRNIPNELSQQAFVDLLDAFCLKYNEPGDGRPTPEPKAAYDFVYMPMDFVSQANLGYAFVNCNNIATTKMLYRNLNGSAWEGLLCQKVCRVCYARIQGRAALLEHFNSANLPNHHSMTPYEYMPTVFNPPRDGRNNPRGSLAINTFVERALLQRLTVPVQTPAVCIATTTTIAQQPYGADACNTTKES